ncbi:MAG: helix-turn-helix domain-containing protein [Tumebacillaceae bacterium]
MNELYRDATLGDMLRERRMTLNMTMREVAGTDLSPTAVNNIEKGKIKPTIETVLYLCKVLKLMPERLLLFHHDLNKSIPELLKIVDSFILEERIDESITLLYDMHWVATEQSAPEELIAEIQFKLSRVFGLTDRYSSAYDVMLEAYKHFVVNKNIPKQMLALNSMGEYSIAERKYDLAISTCTQALDLMQRFHVHEPMVVDSYHTLVKAYFQSGNLKEALYYCKQAKEFIGRLDDLDGLAHNALQEAVILAALDETPEAYEIALHTYRYFETTDNRQSLAEAACVLGEIQFQRRQFSEAKEYYLQAMELSRSHKLGMSCTIKMGLSDLELAQQNTSEARRYAEEGLRCVKDMAEQAQIHKLLARCNLQSGDLEGYRVQMQAAVEALRDIGEDVAAALMQCELADETDDMNLMRVATRKLREIHALCHRI